jgi:hypothetical protein
MTERPERAPGATPDEPLTPDEAAPLPSAEEAPTAETETSAPEAPVAATEEIEAQTGALDPESDAAQVDEIEAELEAEEAAEDEIEAELEAEDEADELDAEGETDEFDAEDRDQARAPGTGATTTTAVIGAAPTGSALSRRRGAPAPSVQRAPTQSELAVHVTENASRVFVIATVVVFVAILAFGLLAGTGGLLTATPAPPTAVPSVSADPSASAG